MFTSPGSRFNRKRALSQILTKFGLVYGGGAGAPSSTAALAAGQFIVGGSTVPVLPATSDLFWDATNKRLGVGTNIPSTFLDLASSASSAPLIRSYGNTYSGIRLDTSSANGNARNWGVVSNYTAYGDFGIVQSNAVGGDITSAGTTRLYFNNAGNVQIPALTNGLLSADGSGNITAVAAGGVTLLGTLTTTSGATQTLSGLTLTSYKFLAFSVNGVSASGGGNWGFTLGGAAMTNGLYTTGVACPAGFGWVDLANSIGSCSLSTPPVSGNAGGAFNSTYTTGTTSVVFGTSTGTFGAGSIKVYGVK